MTVVKSILILEWIFLLVSSLLLSSSASSNSSPILLRIRKADGSMERVTVPHEAKDSTTLSSILASALAEENDEESIKCQIGANKNIDTSLPITSLGLKHGSLVTIIPPPSPRSQSAADTTHESEKSNRYTAFDPFPNIAKETSFTSAARRQRALARLPNRRGTSYSEISKLQSNMHSIVPQSDGPLKRIYMCHVCAQRFKDGCTVVSPSGPKKKRQSAGPKVRNKCALLFGTVQKERVDRSKKAARTSLSTPLYEMKTCEVVKVQALWEPPRQEPSLGGPYDSTAGLWTNGEDDDGGAGKGNDAGKKKKKKKGNLQLNRVLKLGEALGLRPVGWIYSYSDDRLEDSSSSVSDEDALPVWGRDVVLGARAQIQNMERMGREEGSKFATLALDANTGATEAFQLSDVGVQMVAEGVLTLPNEDEDNGRIIKTHDPIVIDAKETLELDSVLCLVNTAMLSHVGNYAGKEHVNSVKKNGIALTAKAKKKILSKLNLEDSSNDGQLIKELCDFNILMVLDRLLGKSDMKELCGLVSKYTRGQKRGTTVDQHLKLVLKSILEA